MAIISMDDAREEQLAEKGKRKAQRIYEGLNEEEFEKLLNGAKKPHHKLAFLLAYGSGLRISEVINIQKDDIDIKSNRIFIRQGKNSKDRVVNIPKQLKEKYLDVLPFKITQRALEAVFLRISLRVGINKVIGDYDANGKKIPIYKFHFHSLRHSFAQRSLAKGLPPHYLQALMGHESLATTNRYTKANPKDAIDAAMARGI